jgi:hypothetical protein
LELVGDKRQNVMRDQYWREQLTNIPIGTRAGVWDHTRIYAETHWVRTHAAKKARVAVYGDKRKFAKMVRENQSALLTTVVVDTRCVVCDKRGQQARFLAACPLEAHHKGDTLQDAVKHEVQRFASNGSLQCGCGGNAAKRYNSKATTMARLLVVVAHGRAAKHHSPMPQMNMGKDGMYDLSGIGQCSGHHWVCTFKLNKQWYHYNDIATNNNPAGACVPVDSYKYKPPGFTNDVYYYTKT